MANDEVDALDALDREAKEYDKVGLTLLRSSASALPSDCMVRMLRSIVYSKPLDLIRETPPPLIRSHTSVPLNQV